MFRCIVILALLATQAQGHPTPQIRALFDGPKVLASDGNANIDTPFAIASVGKLFTSVAILKLAEEGTVSLDDAVSDWLPGDVVDGLGGLDGMTVIHLATMTAGLPDYFDDGFLELVEDNGDTIFTATDAVAHVYGEAPLFTPGTGFDYSNTNYVLLGLIIEDATGVTYADAIAELVLSPLGLDRSFVFGSRPLPDDFTGGHHGWGHVRDYYANPGFGDGGIISTASDLATLYAAIRSDRFLTATSRHMLTTDPIGSGYGMGLVIDGRRVSHSGGDLGATTHVEMDWDSGQIAVQLIGQSDANTHWAETALD